ncbi:MAG: TraB/GumN family protein [Pyrinomonadaceae bacterium]
MKKNRITKVWLNFTLVAWVTSVFFVPSTAIAQAQKAQLATIPVVQKTPSLMWKATAANGKTIYMFGSIHLGTKDFYPLPVEIEDAFAQSDKLLVEADIGKIDQTAMQNYVSANGVYAGDDTLFNHLSPAGAEKLKKFSADNGLPVEGIVKLKPWIAAITIAVIPMMKSGYQPEFGIDKYFLDKARDKKQIVEIESADWQLKLLSETPEPIQLKFLESTLDQAVNFKDYSQNLLSAWSAADVKRLESFFTSESGEPIEIQKKLLDDRNPRMANFAEQCLKTGEKCFVVVGAGHLIGAKGIVQLLKERGYKVEQIMVTPGKKS